jgi:ABC-type sugar transport system substrate-binding protein
MHLSSKFSRIVLTACVSIGVMFAVAACGSSSSSSSGGSSSAGASSSSSSGSANPVKQKTLGLVLITGASESIQNLVSVYDNMVAPLGWKTIKVDAGGDPVKLTKGVDGLIAQKPDAVLLVAVDSSQIRPELIQLKAAGTPVCAFTEGGSAAADQYFNIVAAEDEYKFGKTLGDYIAKNVASPKIIMLANPQNYAGIAREKGVMDGLKANPNAKVVFRQVVDFADPAGSAAKGATSGLQTHPDANVIIPIFDFSLPPAVKVVQQSKSSAKVFGFYLNSVTSPLLRKGASSPIAAVADNNVDVVPGACIDQLLKHFQKGQPFVQKPLLLADNPVPIVYNVVTPQNIAQKVPSGNRQFSIDSLSAPWIAKWKKDYGIQ